MNWYPFPTASRLGVDLNEKNVLNGARAFELADTIGLPLDMTLVELHDRGWTIHWPTFVLKAMLAGWSRATIRSKILEAIQFVYRGEPLEERLDQLLGWAYGQD